MKKVKHIGTAVLLIIIGIALGLLPIIPGFIFAIIGYIILGIHFPVLLRPIDAYAAKNPRIQKKYEYAKAKVRNYL